MSSGDVQQADRRRWNRLAIRFAALVVLGVVAVVVALAIQQLQLNALSMIRLRIDLNNSRHAATAAMRDYLRDGNHADLRIAATRFRAQRGILEGVRVIRRDPGDDAGARAAMARAGVQESDMGRLIWTYRWLRSAPYARDTFAQYDAAVPHIESLDTILSGLQAMAPRLPDPAQRERMLRQVLADSQALAALEAEFDTRMMRATKVMFHVGLLISLALVALFTWGVWQLMVAIEQRIRRSEGVYRLVLDQATLGMLRTRLDGSVYHANTAVRQMFDLDGQADRGWDSAELVVPAERGRWRDFLAKVVEGDKGHDAAEFHCLGRDGEIVMRCSATVTTQSAGRGQSRSLLLVLEDVSEAQELQRLLSHRARHDSLTDTLNRIEIERLIQHAVDSVHVGDEGATVLLINIDRFRLINDTCGHPIGDRLLVRTARRLVDLAGPHGHVGRLSGDEFLILLPLPPEQALAVAESMVADLSEAGSGFGRCTFNATCSIGLVGLDPTFSNARQVIVAADTACHLAKRSGGNTLRAYLPSDADVARRRAQLEWVSDLREAMEHDRLRLWAQPIVAIDAADKISHFEVLVRIEKADGSLHMPAEFLPAAELNGMMPEVDRRIVEMVVQALDRERPHSPPGELCFINLSCTSLSNNDFVWSVLRLLDERPELCPRLCFEITENGMMQDFEPVLRFVTQVRRRGCKVALDDFGTGMSSFSHLRVLPADIIKIDGAFVKGLERDRTGQVLLRSICEMSKVLGKKTVVEWIASDAILQFVREAGADWVQGYHLGAPEPLTNVLRRLPPAPAVRPVTDSAEVGMRRQPAR